MTEQQWQYDTAPDHDQSLIERLRHFPREPDILIYGLRSISSLFLRCWLRAYNRLQVSGIENLPVGKSFIMVANHSSHLDAMCLLSALPFQYRHRAFPAAAADYFFVSVPRVAFTAIFVNGMPFQRQFDVRHSLDLCRGLLQNTGNILILFPEGTRSLNGELADFRPGIGLLATWAGVPVVPCGLRGAFRAWPKNARLPRPRRLELVIGKPRDYSGMTPGKESARQIAQELHDVVRELL